MNNENNAELAGDLGPVAVQERISSLDTLRGVALFGILLLNIVAMGMPAAAYMNPNAYGGADGPDLAAWVVNNLFFEGTMRGLFSLMFGAGVIMMTSRAEERGGGIDVADIFYRRTLWLFAFGVIHAWLLLWPGEILYTYGLCGLFLFVFRNLQPRTLIILGVIVLASLVPKHIYDYATTMTAWDDAQAAYELQEELADGEELDEESQGAIDAWEAKEQRASPPTGRFDDVIDGVRGYYFDIIATRAQFTMWFQSTGLYTHFFFDAIGMMFIGMAFLKLGILTGARSTRFYLAMMLIGYGVGLPVNAWETQLLVDGNFGPLFDAKAELTYDLGRLFMTFGHIGLIMIVCTKGWLTWLTRPLAAVGRMALTNYVMHSIFAALIFTGIGFALFGSLDRHELYYVVGGIWLFQLIVSPIWLKYYRFGPLEWIWRSLTYNRRQPMRRVPLAPRESAIA